MSTSKAFGIGTYYANNNLCRIDAMTGGNDGYQPVVAADDFVYGVDVHSPEIFAYNEQYSALYQRTIRTYAMYVFAKQSTEFPNLPLITLWAVENPWSYIYRTTGYSGTLTYNNETYAYGIWLAYIYVVEDDKYYSYYNDGGIQEYDPSATSLDRFSHFEDGQDIPYTEFGRVGNVDDAVSSLYTVATATQVLDYLMHSHTPGSGQVTLKLKAPGQNLTFTSSLWGSSKTAYIDGDTEITLTQTKQVTLMITSEVDDVVTIKDSNQIVRATVSCPEDND